LQYVNATLQSFIAISQLWNAIMALVNALLNAIETFLNRELNLYLHAFVFLLEKIFYEV